MYPAECGEQLGRDCSKFGSSKSFVLKSLLGRAHIDSSPLVSLTLWDTLVLVTTPLPSPHTHGLSIGHLLIIKQHVQVLDQIVSEIYLCSMSRAASCRNDLGAIRSEPPA